MKSRIFAGVSLSVALLAGTAIAADSLKPSPPKGTYVSPFNPLNVTGPFVGKKQCLV